MNSLVATPSDLPTPAERAELTIRVYEEAGLTVELSVEQMKRVHDEMAAVVVAAEQVRETIRELAGPEPGPAPQYLVTILGMGAGYFRTATHTIERLFQERNTRRRQRNRKEAKSC